MRASPSATLVAHRRSRTSARGLRTGATAVWDSLLADAVSLGLAELAPGDRELVAGLCSYAVDPE
jgi:hypothetical protein